ncbi:MAG: SpoIID/LytB domain-containing protein [Nitriliruptorales bacterium]|nr:SpoIID/LytB domain-containing protein [Nitriliruptorales bacterium]
MRTRSTALIIVLCALMLGVVAIGAGAAGCPASGGSVLPFPSPAPTSDIQFVGRGWGHGVGMSQYAARGGARLGCSAAELLTTMFPGTTVSSTQPIPSNIRVGLYPSGPSTGWPGPVASLIVENLAGYALTWKLDGSDAGSMPTGASWTVNRVKDGGFTITGAGAPAGELGNASSILALPLAGTHTIRLPAKGRTYRYGRLEFGAATSTKAWVTLDIANVDKYLYGLGEMPASWGDDAADALKAQAIAARNYAVRAHGNGLKGNCNCHLYDSTADQVYAGKANEDPRWIDAVEATSGKLLTHNGTIAQTFYSSSHGGWSESSVFTWGGNIPYLQPVDLSRWEAAGDVPATHAQWTLSIDPTSLGDLFGIGPVIDVDLPHPHGMSGRIGNPARGYPGVILRTASETHTVSGNTFRSVMNGWSGSKGYLFRSTLFRVIETSNPPVPLSGDWDGDGDDDVGWFIDGHVALRMGDGSTVGFDFGDPGDTPIVGDWDGDGIDTIGVVNAGWWRLRNTNSTGTADVKFSFGWGTDVPLAGNWDGVPGDEIGIRRDKTFRLKFGLGGGTADVIFGFGLGSDIPITGDFDANGVDDVGVVRDNAWRMKFSFQGGPADLLFYFARPNDGDVPVTGDWDGDGLDTVGVVRDTNSFRLKNAHAGGSADLIIFLQP